MEEKTSTRYYTISHHKVAPILSHTDQNFHTFQTPTLQYQTLMCESIMSLYQHNSWSALHTRKTQTHLHWILQALGSGMAIAGMIVYVVDRQHHFISLHARLGLASGVFTVLGVLNGTSALWARELFRWVKPVYTKLFHNIIGIAAFTTGMSSLLYGFNKFPFRIVASDEVIVAIQIMSGLTIFFSLFGAAKSLVRLVQGVFPNLCYREEESDGEQHTHKAAA